MEQMENHYKNLKVEPIDFIIKYHLSFCYGNVIKYISRYKYKNGEEDLLKAIRYVEYIRKGGKEEYEIDSSAIDMYCEANGLIGSASDAIHCLFEGNFISCIVLIQKIIKENGN